MILKYFMDRNESFEDQFYVFFIDLMKKDSEKYKNYELNSIVYYRNKFNEIDNKYCEELYYSFINNYIHISSNRPSYDDILDCVNYLLSLFEK